MAEVQLLLECTASGLVDKEYPNDNIRPSTPPGSQGAVYDLSWTIARDNYKRAYFKFAPVPENIKFKRLYSVTVYVYGGVRMYATPGSLDLYAPTRDFDPGTITWNTRTAGEKIANGVANFTGYGISFILPIYSGEYGDHTYKSESAHKLLKYGGAYLYSPTENVGPLEIYDIGYRLPPHLNLYYDDEVTVLSQATGSGKTSGFVNPHEPQVFAWTFEPAGEYSCAGEWGQTSATFYWRAGTSGSWTALAASGSTQAVTIPAETMPVGTVQWYVTATDDQGTTSTSPIYTISTADSLQIATPVSPIGTVEDEDSGILLTWQTGNSTGTTPTGADLQISSDSTTWSDLAHITGSATQYAAQAGTIPGGTVYWRVRVYNLDPVAGPWSEPAAFVAVAAPPAPIVTAEAVPFAVIRWQSIGQQTWRVTVDGTVYGPYFGADKSFTLPNYLEDGEHTAQVEVQGSFGLWSQAGEATFTVANVPGEAIRLSGVFCRDAELNWETESTAADYLIYRDGARIGHTRRKSFTDRTVLGRHSWQVINRLPGGFYTASNVVQGALCTGELAIALLTGGEWLELTKSRNPTRQENYTLTQTISLRHFAGQEYPEAETSPYKTLQVSFDVSWRKDEEEQALLFESMIGKPIIYKAPSGESMVGIMTAISKNSVSFFRAYAATVQRKNWRDFVDEDR